MGNEGRSSFVCRITASENLSHGAPECRGVDGRISIEKRLDDLKIRQRLIAIDETPGQHLLDISQILPMCALHLRQRLRIQVEMVK